MRSVPRCRGKTRHQWELLARETGRELWWARGRKTRVDESWRDGGRQHERMPRRHLPSAGLGLDSRRRWAFLPRARALADREVAALPLLSHRIGSDQLARNALVVRCPGLLPCGGLLRVGVGACARADGVHVRHHPAQRRPSRLDLLAPGHRCRVQGAALGVHRRADLREQLVKRDLDLGKGGGAGMRGE